MEIIELLRSTNNQRWGAVRIGLNRQVAIVEANLVPKKQYRDAWVRHVFEGQVRCTFKQSWPVATLELLLPCLYYAGQSESQRVAPL